MTREFKTARENARNAISDLLSHKGNATVFYYRNKVNLSKTENELSRILVEVRREI